MKKADLIKFAKKIKRILNSNFKPSKKYVCYSRRIEKIKTDKRICAMTFDDGPTIENNITESIVNTLNKFGAKGTFDIIGTTESNYPDVPGKIGTPSWSGTKYDHYPSFGNDKMAGAANCPQLIEKIIGCGHEITNHTFSHVLFGKKNIIYSSRNVLKGFDEVYNDVKKLHDYIKNNFNYTIKYSRPPHYVDKIKGNLNSYDVYSTLNYNYLAASFDGAGWLPCESENEEISAMILPLQKALEANPSSLCGQIIFQKDGYNMALRAPVTKGIEKQLEILKEYGYRVVTISELLKESPFLDVGRDDPDFEIFNELQKNKAVAFSDNRLMPDEIMTRGELAMLIAPKEEAINRRIEWIKGKKRLPYSIKATHPYSGAIVWTIENKLISVANKKAMPDYPLTPDDFNELEKYFDVAKIRKNPLTRRNVLKHFKNN